MARIMKVRTIPRGYVGMDGLKGFVREHGGKSPAEWFMALYGKFGNPQEGGVWSYLLRHNNILIRIKAVDSETMDYDVWVSPGFVQDARRRRTRAVNVIARRLNENKVVFVPDGDGSLYYAVRVRNDDLRRRLGGMSEERMAEIMEESMTDEEREALHGGLERYMPDAKEEIVNTIKEIFDEG